MTKFSGKISSWLELKDEAEDMNRWDLMNQIQDAICDAGTSEMEVEIHDDDLKFVRVVVEDFALTIEEVKT